MAKVTLKINKGENSGESFTFEEKDSLILGREEDCSIKLEDNSVSRYHCLMEINPPQVTVRDFGSLNGTYLNGHKIGQREEGMSVEDGRQLNFNEFPMRDGDRLGLGSQCQMVSSIYISPQCAECLCELPEKTGESFRNSKDQPLCPECNERRKKVKAPISPRKPECSICGRLFDPGASDNRIICNNCLSDPLRLLENLLKNATMEKGDAACIKGYRKLEMIGRGGMGEIWLVEEEATGRTMALKVMLPKVALQERNRDRFLLEAKLTAQLQHPNIVTLYKSGCSDGVFFMLMEFCTRGSVDQWMKKHGGTLPVKTAVPIILQVLNGLDYAHNAQINKVDLEDGATSSANGLVHRDLSPHNIFMTKISDKTVAKLADFGLAKAFETAGLTGNTRTGMAAGKPFFMPRQQVINFKYSEPDVDVWAAAASLYNMLTGHVPKDFPKGVDLWHSALKGEAVPIRKRNPDIPEKLAAVIDLALIDRPSIKIKSASTLKKLLLEAL